MDKKQIKLTIAEAGLNPELFAIGTGKTKSGSRYLFASNVPVTNGQILYAIKYYSEDGIFIIWNRFGKSELGVRIPRQCFSVSARKVNHAMTYFSEKYVDFVGHNKERVYIIRRDDLKEQLPGIINEIRFSQ